MARLCFARFRGLLERTCVVLAVLSVLSATSASADSNTLRRLYRRLASSPADVELLEALCQDALDEPDVAVKGDALVVYALGSLHAGRTQQADRITSYLTTVHPEHPAVARLAPQNLNDGCSRCGGSGVVATRCDACGGNGICRACAGKGTRVADGIGGSRILPCAHCLRTGRCKGCQGAGQATTDCVACQGKRGTPSPDRVRAAYKAMLQQVLGIEQKGGSPVATPAPSAVAADMKPTDTQWNTMADYVAAVKSLRERHRAGTIEPTPFDDVFAAPAAHTGRVFRSTVTLLDYHLRAVKVRGSAGPAQGRQAVLTPDTIWIGSKAGRILKQHGAEVPIVVTFGLLNPEQNVLFEVEKAETTAAVVGR